MEKLTTPRLLAYKAKLMKVNETPDWDNPNSYSKLSDSWKVEYEMIKDVLAAREHIKNK